MKEIPLTQGLITIVDDEDYNELSKHKWFANKANGYFYAVRNITLPNKKQTIIKMHRQILGITDRLIQADHINHNTLDNRRSNLRQCNASENQRNSKPTKKTSAYKGVSLKSDNNKWVATICLNRKQMFLGYFDKEEDAANAYKIAADKYHGEFAHY